MLRYILFSVVLMLIGTWIRVYGTEETTGLVSQALIAIGWAVYVFGWLVGISVLFRRRRR